MALGSENAAIPATQILNIRGTRECGRVMVRANAFARHDFTSTIATLSHDVAHANTHRSAPSPNMSRVRPRGRGVEGEMPRLE